jgi:uncharacterized protein
MPELLPLANLGRSERPGGQRLLYTQKGTLVTERSVRPEQYGRFMCAIEPPLTARALKGAP